MRRPAFILLAAAAAAASSGASSAAPPYVLRATTVLPEMPEGDFDQLVADVPRHRLYVSAEDGATMYVFDLRTGALLLSGGAVRSPHKVDLDARHGRLSVADGDGSVKVLATADLSLIASVPVGPKADAGVMDAAHHVFYVGSRDPACPDVGSIVSAISTDSLKVIATYDAPATTLKGMVLDEAGRRILVSMRDKDAIGVIHLDTGTVAIWHPAGLHRSVPLVLDAGHGAVYAGSRGPGELDVLDVRDGRTRATLPSTETSDSMSFDRGKGRLYVSGDSGMSRYDVMHDGKVRLLETDPALVGKTSLYISELHRIFVMRPRRSRVAAAMTMFDVEE